MNAPTFTFSDGDQLISQLHHHIELFPTGVWEFRRIHPSATPPAVEARTESVESPVYLGISQGRFIYSGREAVLSWVACVDVLQRSLPKLRSAAARQQILHLENSVSREHHALLGSMINKLVSQRLVDYEDTLRAFRTSILVMLEYLIGLGPGYATFIPNYQLVASAPIQGFELETLITGLERRQSKWQQLKPAVPSMQAIPVLNAGALEAAALPPQQKERLTVLLAHQNTLSQIASRFGKDPLAVANTFSGLIEQKLVSLQLPANSTNSGLAAVPQVFVVDDSPVLIRQFVKLVTHWGYRVQYSSDATTAVAAIAEAKPDAIFLDINMPEANGFDLIKQIRKTGEISSTPLVLLTAENSVSNKWRAQWASCKFLSKPSTSTEVLGFRDELQAILHELAPLSSKSHSPQGEPTPPLQTTPL